MVDFVIFLPLLCRRLHAYTLHPRTPETISIKVAIRKLDTMLQSIAVISLACNTSFCVSQIGFYTLLIDNRRTASFCGIKH